MSLCRLASSWLCQPHARDTHTCASRHRSDRAALDQFHHLPVIFGGVDLDAHLGGHFRLGRRLANPPRFPDVMRQRLLAIDVLAVFQREHRRKGVRVLAGAHDHGVEFLRLDRRASGNPSNLRRLRVLRRSLVQVLRVDVAQRHDVLGGDRLHVARAAAARADDGDVELVVEVLPAQERRRNRDAPRSQSGAARVNCLRVNRSRFHK